MFWRVCAIYDAGAKVFSQPFAVRHVAEARRSVQQTVNDGQSTMAKYPDQFSLWQVADWDDDKGVMVALAQPELVTQAAALVK